MKRYAVTIDLYIHAENDSDVIQQAEKVAEKIGNDASVLEIWENKFGSLDHRKVILCEHCDEEGLYELNLNGHDVMAACTCGKYEQLKQ